jgi:hypothetical protein
VSQVVHYYVLGLYVEKWVHADSNLTLDSPHCDVYKKLVKTTVKVLPILLIFCIFILNFSFITRLFPHKIAVGWLSTLIRFSYEISIDYMVSSLLEMSIRRKSLKGIHSSLNKLKLSSKSWLLLLTGKVFSSIVTPL